jgi:hypothetical protein
MQMQIWITLAIIIVAVPYIPTIFLSIFDLLIIRLVVVLGLLWAISRGPVIGIFAFTLIAVLYLERNRRKIEHARVKFTEIVDVNTPVQMTIEEEGVPQKVVPVQEYDTPENRIMYYMPKPGCAANSNDFVPPPKSQSLNDKVVFPTIPQSSKSAGLYERLGFGHIPGMASPS